MSVRVRQTGHALRSHNQRITTMERRILGGQQEAPAEWVWSQEVFDYGGGTSPSKRFAPPLTCELVGLYATLTDDGSTATTVDLSINGGAQETLTVASSAFSGIERVSHFLSGWFDGDGDYMQLEAALGTGADGLLVHALFRRRA